MNQKEEIEMVTTHSGVEVPMTEATFYDRLQCWLTDDDYEQLRDDGRVVYCEYYEEDVWESHTCFGAVDRYGNTGYFHRDSDYICCRDCDYNYVINSDVADEIGLHYWESDGDYHLERDESEDYLFDYHSGNRHFSSEAIAAEWRIAYEVEKEDSNMRERGSAWDCFNDTKWAKERDGSLCSTSGFEFISPVFDMFKVDANTFSNVADYINADYSKDCGGHINISHMTMTPRELYDSIKSYMPMLYALYNGRTKNTYCPAISKHSSAHDKYGAVYLKDSRLEFRIFSAVKNVTNLLWRTELIKYMVSNRDVSEAQVLKNMLDGRSKLHNILRKVYDVDQVIKKGELFYKYCREYSFDIIDTKNYLVKRKIIKEAKKKKKVIPTSIEGTVWDNPIIIVDWDDLTPEQQDDFMNNTTSPMTTLPIETN